MPINSKQKGSGFELKVAKLLTEWSGEKFHRTPMSGALHWSNDTRVVSDIVPPQSLVDAGWPFSIECKKVESSWEISNFIEGTAIFWKHWKQCYDDSQREHMVPLLVFNKNYREVYVSMTTDAFTCLEVHLENVVYLECQGWNLVVVKLCDLLNSITCEELISKNLLNTL